jgi:hypothetical protein
MSLRESLTPAQRDTPLNHTIDPGFVHHRKIETILGASGMEIIDNAIRALPDQPDWQRQVRIDHIYTHVFLLWCKTNAVRPLGEVAATRKGRIFCSTEELGPCPDIYEGQRAISAWQPEAEYSQRVEFHYSTRWISSDTLRSTLRTGGIVSIIGEQVDGKNDLVIFEPIVMGSPWLESNNQQLDFDPMWWGTEFFENFVEDIDEFEKVSAVPIPPSPDPMKLISERAFKTCLAEILGDSTSNDWGGETSDFFAAHLHLKGHRFAAAFLLKGPARFGPMGLNHLGKNNDQIVRLSHEPADMLIVQHCHEILAPVRATLRAFAVQPSRPRRYCLIDGRDSLRLLHAYDLYERAIELSA